VNNQEKPQQAAWKWGIASVFLLVALGITVYLVHFGSTDSWPQTNCSIVGSRVVRDDLQDQSRFTVLYRGEYHLRYVVNGQEYFVWAKSGWKDVDQRFVQSKLDEAGRCDFRVRYNPAQPSDAIAVRQ